MQENSFKDIDDIELINVFQLEKSNAVFEELYQRYKDIIFNYVQRLLYNQPEDIINELLNEIFLKVYLKLSKLKNPYAFKVWLFRIARNISINYMKSNKFPYISLDNLDVSINIENVTDSRIDIEANYINNEIKKNVFFEINKLDSKLREIIILKFFNKLTYQEISDITNKSVRTLKNKIRNTFDKINQKLKRKGYI